MRRRGNRSNHHHPDPIVGEEHPLRAVVLQHADECFVDTDGVTRDAARMLEIMGDWVPNRSDQRAGVRRNEAFDPELVVVVADMRVCRPVRGGRAGESALLYTIVPRDHMWSSGPPLQPPR